MASFRRFTGMALMAAALAAAQPALTTIQDVLYRADGTRFNGTMFITYNSFQAGDTSNIATANLTVPIVNGVLRVELAPTTTASAGAQYNITYNSNGVNQFTQVWAVPPSSVPLRVRDVLVSTGTVIGPPPVTSPVQISDVVGLGNALALGAQRGVGFILGRAAVINQSGQIDGASGNLSDCVRVDGTSGPCGAGSGGILPSFADSEVPAGAINGTNAAFTLSFAPSPAGSLELYRNGLRLQSAQDYQISGNTVTFFTGSIPQPGDLLLANYRYGNPSNPLSSLASPQVVCSSSGGLTSGATSTSLGTCTIPAGLLGSGDRLEVQFQYSHAGSGVGFTGEIHIGTAVVLSRSPTASESLLVGKATFGIYSGGQVWDAESWGASTALQSSAGASGIDTSQALTVDFRGQMASAGTETLTVRNFTVIRYPAQSNP